MTCFVASSLLSALTASLLLLAPPPVPPSERPPVHGVAPSGERSPKPLADPARPPAEGLELVMQLDQTPGNVAVTPQGRLFVSLHPFGDPAVRVVELKPTVRAEPYPSPAWAGAVGANGVGIQSIIGIRSDPKGILWMLDAGKAEGPDATPPKLVAWDTKTDRLVRVIHLPPPATKPSSFLQDFAIDSAREAIIIADAGIGAGFEHPTPAFVVVYLRTGASRRVLDGAASLQAEPDAAMVIDGREVRTKLPDGTTMAPRVGLDPITIDAANEWVYYGPMHGTSVYRVKAEDLENPGLSDELLGERIEKYGPKPVSDGMSIDAAGNLYLTDVTAHAIGVLKTDRTYERLLTDERLQWPDGISGGPDGNFYVVVNQLHRHAMLNEGVDATKPPFVVYRFRGLAPAVLGR